MKRRHVQWGPPIQVLDVWVSPCLKEELHAKSPVVGEGSVMERGLALVVEGIQGDIVLEEDEY